MRVDLLAISARLRGIGDADDVPADDPLAELPGLVEVVVVEEELGRVDRPGRPCRSLER